MRFQRFDTSLLQTAATLDQRRRLLRAARGSLAAMGASSLNTRARAGLCSSADSVFGDGFGSLPSFAQDNVFSDGGERQMLSLEGSVGTGYVGTIDIGVAL